MAFDHKRQKRVEEALVNELGLQNPSSQAREMLQHEVRKFLAMLDAALEAPAEPADEGKPRIPTRNVRR
jgi:hypothetical protein